MTAVPEQLLLECGYVHSVHPAPPGGQNLSDSCCIRNELLKKNTPACPSQSLHPYSLFFILTPLFSLEYVSHIHKDLELGSAESKKSQLNETKVAAQTVSC